MCVCVCVCACACVCMCVHESVCAVVSVHVGMHEARLLSYFVFFPVNLYALCPLQQGINISLHNPKAKASQPESRACGFQEDYCAGSWKMCVFVCFCPF